MKLPLSVKNHFKKSFIMFSSWEQEQTKRRRKWRAERRRESVNKDESEKDSDSSESPPDSTETREVAVARESLVNLMAEQKKIQKQKVSFLKMCLKYILI